MANATSAGVTSSSSVPEESSTVRPANGSSSQTVSVTVYRSSVQPLLITRVPVGSTAEPVSVIVSAVSVACTPPGT